MLAMRKKSIADTVMSSDALLLNKFLDTQSPYVNYDPASLAAAETKTRIESPARNRRFSNIYSCQNLSFKLRPEKFLLTATTG
jgi:hypothetical protein